MKSQAQQLQKTETETARQVNPCSQALFQVSLRFR